MFFGKTYGIKVTASRRQVFFVLTLCLIISLPLALGTETYTFTSYYPAPSGVFGTLRVMDSITTGRTKLINDSSVSIPTVRTSQLDMHGASYFVTAPPAFVEFGNYDAVGTFHYSGLFDVCTVLSGGSATATLPVDCGDYGILVNPYYSPSVTNPASTISSPKKLCCKIEPFFA